MDPSKHKLYESALIKSIRRGQVDDAVYWGVLLYKFGYAEHAWRRFLIHLSEDIGIAERDLPASIAALHANWATLMAGPPASYEANGVEQLPYVHAIMLLATAKKSRAVNHASIVHFSTNEDREVPDYAIDFHSPMGKRMGRDLDHFVDIAAKIENEDTSLDWWKDKAMAILRRLILLRWQRP